MGDSILQQGGPFNTRRVGHDRYEMTIPIPTDVDGLVGRECPNASCSPGYFKLKLGTGITGGQVVAYCPYCRQESEPSNFATKAQIEYATKVLENEVIKGMDRVIKKSLGLGLSGRKKIGSGMFSLEMSYKPGRPRHISRPYEEELRRDITCPFCGLVHAVFGLATWCPDCGMDIFMNHVEAELVVVRKVLGAIETRRTELGARVAARDIENALEDVVSVFETVLKTITKRYLLKTGIPSDEVTQRIEKIRNAYQNVSRAEAIFRSHTGLELYADVSADDVSTLRITLEKRHPITHNLGIIDRKYLDQVLSGEVQGREVRVTADEVEQAVGISLAVLRNAYKRVIGPVTGEQMTNGEQE